jgi:hypothetical protein
MAHSEKTGVLRASREPTGVVLRFERAGTAHLPGALGTNDFEVRVYVCPVCGAKTSWAWKKGATDEEFQREAWCLQCHEREKEGA